MIDNLLNDRYRLDAELGQGGMGIVYRAHDTLLDRTVAVKVVSKAALGTEGRARLMHEAEAVPWFNHPSVVSVYDAGDPDGLPFWTRWSRPRLLREWAEAHLSRGEPGDWERARELLLEAKAEFEAMAISSYAAQIGERLMEMEDGT
jgi:serine/threonine protein kinase